MIIKLDRKKLLGFRILTSSTSAKVGGKPTIWTGAKIGVKSGDQAVALTSRAHAGRYG